MLDYHVGTSEMCSDKLRTPNLAKNWLVDNPKILIRTIYIFRNFPICQDISEIGLTLQFCEFSVRNRLKTSGLAELRHVGASETCFEKLRTS